MSSGYSFESTKSFVQAGQQITQLAKQARAQTGPAKRLGLDPFSIPIRRNRQLCNLQENDYSDWLAWVLDLLAGYWSEDECRKIYRWIFYGQMISDLPGAANELCAVDYGETREIAVQHGHEGHSGRLDIIRPFSKAKEVWHVEVKVVAAEGEGADLGKHEGYVSSLKKWYPGHDLKNILLVTRANKAAYYLEDGSTKFDAVTWEVLAVRFRQLAAFQEIPVFVGSMILLLCAAVEQELLGISRGSPKELGLLVSTNQGGKVVDNLYEEGLKRYAATQCTLRQFERYIDEAICDLMSGERRRRMDEAAGLSDGVPYTNDPKTNESVGLEEWWAWVARKFWMQKVGASLYVGLTFRSGTAAATVAVVPEAGNRERLRKALEGDYEEDCGEFRLETPLKDVGGIEGFRIALEILLDKRLVPALYRLAQ